MSRVSGMPVWVMPFLAATLWLLTGITALADNMINIQGSGESQVNINTSNGNNSVIDIYQVGTGQVNKVGVTSPINQDGSNHTARIGQGATYADGVWTPGTAVSNNSAMITQNGGNDHMAAIYQATGSNTASISQSGSNQAATVNQSVSTLNSAVITQNSAAAVAATITQDGMAASSLIATQRSASAYTLAVTQGESGGHSATLETSSGYDGTGLTVNQTGSTNEANVSGMSGGSASINQSGTGGRVSLVDQTSGALSIVQEGANNALTIENYGSGASAGRSLSVTQTGSTTYNPDPPPNGPTYTAQPP